MVRRASLSGDGPRRLTAYDVHIYSIRPHGRAVFVFSRESRGLASVVEGQPLPRSRGRVDQERGDGPFLDDPAREPALACDFNAHCGVQQHPFPLSRRSPPPPSPPHTTIPSATPINHHAPTRNLQLQ